MRLFFFIVIIVTIANNCRHSSVKENNPTDKLTTDTVRSQFADSTGIGVKGQNKLVIRHYEYEYKGTDSCNLKIFFYEKAGNKWRQIQSFCFDLSCIIDLNDEDEITIQDYNNDGFNDLTYHSYIAARGGNEIRKLFIFSPIKKELEYIRNSEKYPNLSYNKELDCLDAFALYGGSSTYFLKIESDTLREFAKIDLWGNHRTVSTVDKQGKEKVIHEDSVADDDAPYIKYKNFKTLEKYTDD
ncbi:MAG: hypothetical protein LBL79_05285 [Prevotella sp.]|jgi:hypothetical protein|nr:hypothetical protein [Prevotella sp.]